MSWSKRTSGLLAAGALLFAGGLVAPNAASAATQSVDIDGITYSYDDADSSLGATAEGLDGSSPALTDVDIPATVTIGADDLDVVEIADGAFLDESLTRVTIGNNVISIGEEAFRLNDLTSLVLPDSVTTIGRDAFSLANLTSLTLPNSLDTMGTYAFASNDLETVTIPDSVTVIPQGAFFANELTSVTLPDALTRIDRDAFWNNNLTSVTLPSSLITIAEGAFDKNSGLTSVTFTGPAPTLDGPANDSKPTFDTSSGSLVLSYPWRYGDSQTSGGYTSPEWRGYDTQAVATVDFDLNGQPGTAPANQDIVVDDTATEPAEPTAPGHTFTGWFTDVDGAAPFVFTAPITEDTTVYAGWEEVVAPPADYVTVSKTVDASFVRVHAWDLDKTGQVGDITVGDDAASGEVDYTVTATPGDFRDDYYAMSGQITVTSEIVESLPFTVTDTPDVGAGATCEVFTTDGEPAVDVTIGALETVTFDYACELDGTPEDGTNTATVTAFGGQEVSTTEDVVFEQRDTSFATVTVVDDQTTPNEGWVELGDADWNAEGTPTEFSYTLTHDDLTIGECTSFTNVAMITDTEQTTEATVEICPEPAAEPTLPEEPEAPEVPEVPEVPETGGLPETGLDATRTVGAALLLIVAGGAAIMIGRKVKN